MRTLNTTLHTILTRTNRINNIQIQSSVVSADYAPHPTHSVSPLPLILSQNNVVENRVLDELGRDGMELAVQRAHGAVVAARQRGRWWAVKRGGGLVLRTKAQWTA